MPPEMGCSQGAQVSVSHASLDSRQPFTKPQVEEIRAFWAVVKRRFEITATEMLIRFFRHYPYFQVLFKDLKELKDELDMRSSADFENHAMAIFAVIDEVIENLDDDVDGVLEKLEDVARIHARVEGFNSEFFRYLEDPFIEALREKLWERFGESEEELFRKLFKWIEEALSLEVEAIEYRLIPGD